MDPLLGACDGDPVPLVLEPGADPEELPELPGDDPDGAA
jgi:hypothetical protein